MTRNWIAVNFVLLLLAALLGWQLHMSVKGFRVENDLAKLQPVQDPKQKITQEGGLPPLSPPKRQSAAEFANIPAQNVFSESRTKDEKTDTPAVVEIPALQVKPVLVGITLSSRQRLAAIVDPALQTARKVQTKRIGDTYQGYTITDIAPNQIVLEYGTRREVIPLFDAAKHPVQAGKTAIQPTRVIAFGGGGQAGTAGSSGTPIVSTAASRPAAGSPGVAQIGTSPAPGSAGAQAGIARPAAQPGRQTPGIPQQAPSNPSQQTDGQGQRVIRTPFGDVFGPKPPNP
jgi:hypothetical protein